MAVSDQASAATASAVASEDVLDSGENNGEDSRASPDNTDSKCSGEVAGRSEVAALVVRAPVSCIFGRGVPA